LAAEKAGLEATKSQLLAVLAKVSVPQSLDMLLEKELLTAADLGNESHALQPQKPRFWSWFGGKDAPPATTSAVAFSEAGFTGHNVRCREPHLF
jgi:hypothetical protein